LIPDLPDQDAVISSLARKYSFMNAVEHGGKASLGSVLGKILGEKPELRSNAEKVRLIASSEISEINSLSPEMQRSEFEKEFPGELENQLAKKKESSKAASEKKPILPPLENAEIGMVITRFPPEPNGYMHIGHAKASILGYEYSRMYNGKFIVRFDDTNPAAEKKEYYGSFLESLKWLGLNADLVRNA
jgi:glutamyl-tRNA synthetase